MLKGISSFLFVVLLVLIFAGIGTSGYIIFILFKQASTTTASPTTTIGYYETTSTIPIIQANCEKIVYNGDPSEKIDVVFVPYLYDDNELPIFVSQLPEFIGNKPESTGILSKEPFKSNSDKFNFYYMDKSITSLLITSSGSYKDSISYNCPFYDEIILLDYNSTYGGWAYPHVAKVASRILKQDNIDNVRSLLHEFGHSLAGLGDEYTSDYPGSENWLRPNCDRFGCPKWCNGTTTLEEPRDEKCRIIDNEDDCLERGVCKWGWESDKNSLWSIPCFCRFENAEDCMGYEICETIEDRNLCESTEGCEWGTPTCRIELFNPTNYGVDCIDGTGCYQGCEGYYGYRATLGDISIEPLEKGCIMRYGDEFCPISQRELCREIKEVTGSVGGICCEYGLC